MLKLISVALRGEGFGVEDFKDADWKELMILSKEHHVTGVVFCGIERLAQIDKAHLLAPPFGTGNMPMAVFMDWMGQREKVKIRREHFDPVMAEFAQLMDREKVPYVVFKGLAVAAKYPMPETRGMGDIDFYVPETDFDRAIGQIEENMKVEIERNDVDKHYAFDYKGIRFEMHYQMETFGCQKHQEYFGRIIDECISEQQPAYFDCVDTKVRMLPPMEDLMLVFKHWFTHLLGEGVGLRQTTDIAVLIKEYQNEIDIEELGKHLKGIGYAKAFDAVVVLVEKYFGIEWKEYSQSRALGGLRFREEKYADLLMTDILKNGNFGRSDYKNKEGRAKRIETTKRFFTHCWRYFPLAKKDILMSIPKRIAISIKAH